jgi:putative holliday junction resolvase
MPRLAGRLLGVDYGRVRVGVAVSDGLGIVATELGHIPRHDDDQVARTIAALAVQERAAGIVVGLPLNADGSRGSAVRHVKAFVAALRRASRLPVEYSDERYSTSQAEAELRRLDRWPAPVGAVDARAAAVLLRRYLGGEDAAEADLPDPGTSGGGSEDASRQDERFAGEQGI